MNEPTSLASPRVMFVSFLCVVAAFVVCWLSWGVVALVLAALFFPESFELLTRETLAGSQTAGQMNQVMPAVLFGSTGGIHVIVCWAVGWGLIRLASPWRNQQVIFTAVLLFLTYLQAAVQASDGMRWMPMVQMSLQPIAVLAGAKWLGRF